jgi:hypothetical protein
VLAPRDKLERGIVCVPITVVEVPEVAVKVTPVKEEVGRGTVEGGGIIYIS